MIMHSIEPAQGRLSPANVVVNKENDDWIVRQVYCPYIEE